MWKAAGAGAAALLIAGSAFVYAQQRPGPDGMPHARDFARFDFARYDDGGHRHGMRRDMREDRRVPLSDEDRTALTDARLAALKAGLRLSPEQEKNWPAAEAAIREFFKERQDRMHDMRDRMADRRDRDDNRDPIERLRNRAKSMTDRAAALTRLADATEPLYKSLDEAQKRRLDMLARPMRLRGSHEGPGHRGPRPSGVERL